MSHFYQTGCAFEMSKCAILSCKMCPTRFTVFWPQKLEPYMAKMDLSGVSFASSSAKNAPKNGICTKTVWHNL